MKSPLIHELEVLGFVGGSGLSIAGCLRLIFSTGKGAVWAKGLMDKMAIKRAEKAQAVVDAKALELEDLRLRQENINKSSDSTFERLTKLFAIQDEEIAKLRLELQTDRAEFKDRLTLIENDLAEKVEFAKVAHFARELAEARVQKLTDEVAVLTFKLNEAEQHNLAKDEEIAEWRAHVERNRAEIAELRATVAEHHQAAKEAAQVVLDTD